MAGPEFWSSRAGIFIRLEQLAGFISTKTNNRATLVYGDALGITRFEWVMDWSEGTCAYCFDQSGREYVKGQFMPPCPAHPGCNCGWDVKVPT